MKKTNLVVILAFISIVAAGLTGCGKKSANTAAEPVIPVKVMKASTGTVTESTNYAVTVEPIFQSNVSPKINGKVVSVPVVLGSYVRKGQVLVQLDRTDAVNGVRQAEAALASARANLNMIKAGSRPQEIAMAKSTLNQAKVSYELSQKNYDRMKSLFDQNLISRSQFEQAEMALTSARAAYKTAQESLSMAQEGATHEQIASAEASVHAAQIALLTAKSQLPYTVITSPISGYVTMLNINPGEMASPGAPVVGVADLSRVYAVANVGQSVIAILKKGAPTSVAFEINGERYSQAGRVDQFALAADSVTKTYKIKILLQNPNQKLKAGMVGKANFALRTSRKGSIVVPQDAIVSVDGEDTIYIAKGNRAVARRVVTGISDGKKIEIITGLTPNDRIIIAGQNRLKPSARIEVK